MFPTPILLFLLALNSQPATPQARDAKAIEAAKNTNVRQIEPSLPDKKLEQWLRDVVGAQAETQWKVNDCGEQTGVPALDEDRDFPICAEAQVTLAGKRKLHVLLAMGTHKTGVKTGPASFFYAVVVEPDGSQTSIKTLSRLPDAIKPAINCPKRHPPGARSQLDLASRPTPTARYKLR